MPVFIFIPAFAARFYGFSCCAIPPDLHLSGGFHFGAICCSKKVLLILKPLSLKTGMTGGSLHTGSFDAHVYVVVAGLVNGLSRGGWLSTLYSKSLSTVRDAAARILN
jgi:hypothetical protein